MGPSDVERKKKIGQWAVPDEADTARWCRQGRARECLIVQFKEGWQLPLFTIRCEIEHGRFYVTIFFTEKNGKQRSRQ